MISLYFALDRLLDVLRVVFFWAALIAGVIALADWLVRTRRISPFGRVARFFRASVDPFMAPVERRIVRAGGLPTSAPWWTLAAIVVGGIIVLTLLQALLGHLRYAMALAAVPGGILQLLLGWTFGLLQFALMVRVVSAWFGMSPYGRWVRWSFILTNWMIEPLRRIIPPLGPVDVTPLVAYMLLYFGRSVISGLFI